MARSIQVSRERLASLIRVYGPISATELAARLGANRATIVRSLGALGDELVTLGRARSTRYVMRRTVRNAGNSWPIYHIDEAGRARLWAQLEAIFERRWRITWAETSPIWAHHFVTENGICGGFPFFLGSARPQGFLGRAIARQVSRSLQVPEEPRQWSDDDTLVYLQAASEDLPGALVVGDDCLRRALGRSVFDDAESVLGEHERGSHYPTLAQNAAASMPDSSAAGEQPKFLTNVRTAAGDARSVLVKFSPPFDQPTGRRWADLLLCEFHAHQVLAEHNLTDHGVEILDAGNRRFLEVRRFDRTSQSGRRSVVSLEALHAAGVGSATARTWLNAAAELGAEGLIDSTSIEKIHRLHAFGELIGNNDMHFGNLSFWVDDASYFQVAPAYDMLPMLWAPGAQGEIIERTFAPRPPLPSELVHWTFALRMAEIFWNRVIVDSRLSHDFVRYAKAAQATLQKLSERMGTGK